MIHNDYLYPEDLANESSRQNSQHTWSTWGKPPQSAICEKSERKKKEERFLKDNFQPQHMLHCSFTAPSFYRLENNTAISMNFLTIKCSIN